MAQCAQLSGATARIDIHFRAPWSIVRAYNRKQREGLVGVSPYAKWIIGRAAACFAAQHDRVPNFQEPGVGLPRGTTRSLQPVGNESSTPKHVSDLRVSAVLKVV